MILNRLTLVNFGVYRGQQEFDLRPWASRPIVIFGGKNGAGKTTLLEAIRLCLYGPLVVDEHTFRVMKRVDYEQHLRRWIHRNSDGVIPLDWARIELEFEYAVAGQREKIVVEREWRDQGKGVQETLRVSRDDQLVDEMDAAQQGEFIRDLVPPGLMQLAILDGEKIQSLANSSHQIHRLALSHAIKSVLGLDIVEQLQSDLGIYRRRQQKGSQIAETEQQIDALEIELQQLADKEETLLAQFQTIDARVSEVETQREIQEQEIARVGGGFAREREKYKGVQVRAQTEIEVVEQSVRESCAGLLPFAITPVYTEAVKNQLLHEAEYQRWLASKTFIEQKLSEIRTDIESPHFWKGTGAEALIGLQETIGQRVAETLQEMVEPPDAVRDVTLRHYASEPEGHQLLQWIEESRTTVPTALKELTAQLIQLRKERDDAESGLQRVPADDVLGPLMESLNQYNQQFGALAHQRQRLEEDLHRLEFRREELGRNMRKTQEDKTARQGVAEKVHQVLDVQLVLGEFETELIQLRISQLEEAFSHNFNRLCRKDSFVKRVEIDPRDFSVTLIGMDGEQIAQNELSAGEKQIYAVSLVWAIRLVSGRPLPFVIDAPLGRLDSDHRQRLAEHYFPKASHQVLLLSTDTEVDAEFYDVLQDSISHAYHLDYDQSQKSTQVNRGYFWHSDGSEIG